eukprot:gb/GECG01014050.1/.p1 GENE.gb/GECG01014050.1/~~gb/GECG01014050.1/.p1  ORF type:complete len:184 (+),score=44.65 gb/GECG01014050.1/:1-552(+)
MQVPRETLDWEALDRLDERRLESLEQLSSRERRQLDSMVLYGDASAAAPSPGNRTAVSALRAQQLLALSAQYVVGCQNQLEEEEAELDRQIEEMQQQQEQSPGKSREDDNEEYDWSKDRLRAKVEEMENLHAFVERTKPELAARLFVDKHGKLKVRSANKDKSENQASENIVEEAAAAGDEHT